MAGALLLASVAPAQRLPARWSRPCEAETARDPACPPTSREAGTLTAAHMAAPDTTAPSARDAGPWWAPIASAILPGAGQSLQRQRRAIPYVAVEAYLLAEYLDARNEGRERRSRYRSLARIARGPYSDVFPTGDFEYYERMEHFVESGVFDFVPGGALQPETDTATFNGTTWRLARQTYWENPDVAPPPGSPAFQSALDFYARRAIRPEFRWSWRNAQLEQDLYRRAVQGSNNAFRLSSQYLGVVIANHALSAVDAFVRLRVTRRTRAEHGWGLEGSIPWAPLGRTTTGAEGR